MADKKISDLPSIVSLTMSDIKEVSSGSVSYKETRTQTLLNTIANLTSITPYGVGDIFYAASGTTLGRLAAVSIGNVLISNGTNNPATWGKVDLTNTVTGILPIANGGTGLATGPVVSSWNGSTSPVAVTAGSNITITGGVISATPTSPTITLTGDITGSGTTTISTTIATVNSNIGTFGNSSHVASPTVNGKGQITAISNVLITPGAIGAPTTSGSGASGTWAISITGSAGSISGGYVSSLTGTANQIIVSSSTGNVTLSTPQDIGTNSSPTFAAITINGTSANPISFPFPSTNTIYVDFNGNDINNGSQNNPVATVTHAMILALDNYVVQVGAGTFIESAFFMRQFTSCIGQGQNTTFITSTNDIFLPAAWGSSVAPYLNLSDFTVSTSLSLNLTSASFVTSSLITIDNVRVRGVCTIGLIDTVIIQNNTTIIGLSISNISNFKSLGANLSGTLTISVSDATHVPSMSVYIDASEITSLTINQTNSTSISVVILNSSFLTTVTVNGSGGSVNLTFDNIPASISTSGYSGSFNIVNAENTLTNTVKYLNDEGYDFPSSGTNQLPYKTISYATSQILDATPSKVYTQVLTGTINDNGTVYISPNINVFSFSGTTQLINSSDIIPDPAWNTAFPFTSNASWQGVLFSGNLNLDFSSFSLSIAPGIEFYNSSFEGTVTINGNNNNFEVGDPATQVYFSECFDFGYNCDNAFIVANNCTFDGNITFGSGTTVCGHSLYSFVNTYESGNLTFTMDGTTNPRSNVCMIGDLIRNSISVNLINADSSIPYDIQIQSSNLRDCGSITLSADSSIVSGTSVVSIFGCTPIPNLVWQDDSSTGKNITLNIDRSSYPKHITVNNGTPNIQFESNLRVNITGTSVQLEPNRSYLLQNTGTTTLTLPVFFNLGDTIEISSSQVNGKFVIPTGGVIIVYGTSSASVQLASPLTPGFDSLKMTYIATNTWSIQYTARTLIFT